MAPGCSFDDVLELGKSLDGARDAMSCGRLGLKVKQTVFAWLEDDCETLMVRVEPDERERRLREAPGVFLTTVSFGRHAWMRVRLSKIARPQLEEVIRAAHGLALPRGKRR